MKKLKLKITFVFLLGMFLSACGGGGGSDGASGYQEATTSEVFFEARISSSIIQAKCIACHIEDGQAKDTSLLYTPSSNPIHVSENFNVLNKYLARDTERAALMLEKVQGINHTGGQQLDPNSSDFKNLKTFLEMIGGDLSPAENEGEDQANSDIYSGDPIVISDAIQYFRTDISPEIIQGNCVSCHQSDGTANGTDLVYESKNDSNHETKNFNLLKNYLSADPSRAEYILLKAQGANQHGGGARLTAGTETFAKFQSFLASIGGDTGSLEESLGYFWEGVELADAEQTLRRAALIVGRRLPTDAEIAAVKSGGRDTLQKTLLGLMEGEGFHDFLITGANDRLHLEAFLNGLNLEAADLNREFFPIGANKRYEHKKSTGEWPDWEEYWRWGLAMSPLELVAYVVENDRSYKEVVTADYTMVNPILNEVFRSNTGLLENDSHLIYRPGKNNGQILRKDSLKAEFFQDIGTKIDSWGDYVDYPHAGILSSHAFLSRYPTTETNRNRARSRWTYYHFLGVDIEKSAKRTTDPKALADTNNPTMKNRNCTVCHQTLDPVAGAFEDFGNEGFYKDAWGGMDSLPDTYKHPEWFDNNAKSGLYQYGDTWFRDMREPGFNGMKAPYRSNSIQWLGRRISEDSRFATGTIKFWWPAVMGSEVKTAPESTEDADFISKLAAFNEQNQFIEELGAAFAKGINGGKPYNLKDLLVEMMMSPWFRAKSSLELEGVAMNTSDLGSRRLLTPEEMEAKSKSLLGWKWGQNNNPSPWRYDQEWTQLNDRFKLYYGGIDSNGIKDRQRQLTALMSNVAEKQALEMACPAVVLDFDKPYGKRKLFNGIDRNVTPTTEAGEIFTVKSKNFGENFTVEAANEKNPELIYFDVDLLSGGKSIKVNFLNAWYDENVGGRHLHIVSFSVKDSKQNTILFFDRENVVDESETFTCGRFGQSEREKFSLHCNDGYVSVPFRVETEGTYSVEIVVWGEQAGPDNVAMSATIEDVEYLERPSSGEILLKQKLVELHQKFLGEQLDIDSDEINNSYQLLVETWQERKTHEHNGYAWRWPDENCNFYSQSHWGDGSVSRRANDDNQMLYTWTSILIYLMTDFYYLHE